MSQFLGQIYTLLTTPPGNLVYHIVLVFAIAGAFQGAVQSLRSSNFPQARRTVIGLSVMLGLQLCLFAISALTSLGLVNAQLVLPPLDRAVTLLTLIWIGWLWAFPEPLRLADAAMLLLNLLGIILLGLTLFFWIQKPSSSFNRSGYEIVWQVFSIAVILIGAVGLVLRKPNGWSNGLAMLILGFLGHLASLVFPMDGNFPGFVRLAQLAMFPILLTLMQRFPVPSALRAPIAKSKNTDHPIQERRRYSTDPKTFHALLTLAAETEPGKIGQELTHGIAQAMLADLCFLITVGEDNGLSICFGYDLIREENLDGTIINRDSIPLLADAIQQGRSLRLPASSTSPDLKGLGQILSLSNPGNLLSVPVSRPDHGPLGSVLILSPYSNRLWNADDEAFLSNVTNLFIPILERVQRISDLETERDHSVEEAHSVMEQATEAKNKYEQLLSEMESQGEKISQSQVQAENMAALLIMQEEAQKNIEQLKAENEKLRNAGGLPKVPDDQAEREMRQILEEMAHMQNALADANIKILELEKRPAAPITNEQIEVIASISQELRQPMSSIVGYTDLLMGESVGGLGALQRKFVERIKASTERIGGLVDDLIQITNLETGKMEFNPEEIDLNLIIDNAMAYTSTQIREKNITLRLDLTGTTPHIHTDRDALQQILIHLLQNATAATRAEGNITLRVQMQNEDGHQFISIQVSDNGGGISSEDLPRVFARRYRAEHSLIQGVGDTGVGLSIAKALVEAQNGRIWVETEAGVGSTFSVLMPVLEKSPQENQ
ncbi:MAG: ATP-binding protein [Anaerolineales bacterium]|jgi:signal transduction histidine kinase